MSLGSGSRSGLSEAVTAATTMTPSIMRLLNSIDLMTLSGLGFSQPKHSSPTSSHSALGTWTAARNFGPCAGNHQFMISSLSRMGISAFEPSA